MTIQPDYRTSKTNEADRNEITESIDKASDWNEHEHISEQVQIEAEKFIHLVGSPDLAIHAINLVEQRHESLPSGVEFTESKNHSDRNAIFLEVLSNFETTLLAPVVSGEITAWVVSALQSCEKLGEVVRDDLLQLHAELFARILNHDNNLSSQVEKLRAMDKQLSLVDCNEVTNRLITHLSLVSTSKQDEAELITATAELAKMALKFVIAARIQETAIANLLSEALSRELGSGD